MKKSILMLMIIALGCFSHAGMRKQDPVPSITAEVRVFDNQHQIDFKQVVEAEIGQTIGFWLDVERVAVLERREATPKELYLAGRFLTYSNAVFELNFIRLDNGAVHIQGVLVFSDLDIVYTLETDSKNQPCWKEHKADVPQVVSK